MPLHLDHGPSNLAQVCRRFDSLTGNFKQASLRADDMEELQRQVERLQDELDHKVFRPLQKRTFEESAKCCTGDKPTREFHACLERAGQATAQAERGVTVELAEFSARVQRCVQSCADKAQSLVEAKGAEAATASMEKCMNTECGSHYIKELSSIGSKLVKQYKP